MRKWKVFGNIGHPTMLKMKNEFRICSLSAPNSFKNQNLSHFYYDLLPLRSANRGVRCKKSITLKMLRIGLRYSLRKMILNLWRGKTVIYRQASSKIMTFLDESELFTLQ